ncbi:SUN-domain-containing protein [Choiromyces venosus 120613-1]|uniref:SUN-domain-containing protein n=1 Tax=Choiromyces venosus 120613-1 TaxID=1336337 RepID=A0A3N4IZ15_9PEZI|nr:SUN-domain-containing protein [Choiromyces venosus 120613-1]
MKINAGLFSLALAGFSTLAAAQPHGKHARVHGRHARALKERELVTEVKTVWTTIQSDYQPTPTPSISPQEVKKVADAVPTPSTSPTPSASPKKDNKKDDKKSDHDTPNTNKGVDSNSNTSREFKDGVVPCSTFPSDYGAVPLAWFTKDGWSGIQYDGGNIDSLGVCKEGALCSYACPPGFSKGQWPADQPASGESHGGVLCKDGFLTRTRTDFKYLCEAGADGISVKNELSESVAVCRTDYPGSENMVVPLQCDGGSQKNLATPDADSPGAYTWKGGSTSAQYYVNNAGVSVKDGCLWGQPGGEVGNWAPYIFGSGKKGGKIWISVSKNPNNSKAANFNVSIVGGIGDKKCECIMGVCQDGGAGCTVTVEPGQKAYFRLWM